MAFSSSRATILVVDDDSAIRDSLHLILEDQYEVIDAIDGCEALAILGTRKIDLVLLDLVMSGTDGFDVLSTLGKVDPVVPIVVVSALNTAWTAAAALRLGAVDYVTKPFDEEALLTLVSDVLTSQRRPREIPRTRVILVGLNLGVYATLTVLLRESCRIERVSTIADTLTQPGCQPPNVLIAHIDSLGTDALATVRRVRELVPTTHIAVIRNAAVHETPLLGLCQLLHTPGRGSEILRLVLDHSHQPRSSHVNLRRSVSTALDYLCQHLATASVQGMGQAVGVTPHYLSTLFRGDIGQSPRAFIMALRIEAAKWMLLETGEKIESVAAQIGLHDASHLSRLFVKQTGRRPGVYRGRTAPVN